MAEQPQPQQQQAAQPHLQQLQPAQQPACPTLVQRVASAVSGAVQRVEATWLSSAEKSERRESLMAAGSGAMRVASMSGHAARCSRC